MVSVSSRLYEEVLMQDAAPASARSEDATLLFERQLKAICDKYKHLSFSSLRAEFNRARKLEGAPPYSPFSSYTAFVFVVIKFIIGLSNDSMDLILALLRHPDFRPQDIPASSRVVDREASSMPRAAMATASSSQSSTCTSVDLLEVLQRYVLANPLHSSELRFHRFCQVRVG